MEPSVNLVPAPLSGLAALGALVFVRMPLIFKQRSVSVDNQPFMILKFRTRPNADVDLPDTDQTSER